jgi:uncharacterized membrane protein YraQ (UPF0718 family)
MTGTLERHGRWFCSESCAERFARQQAAPSGKHQAPSKILDPWVWVPLSALVLATAGSWWPAAAGASAAYRGYLQKVMPPFLLGLLLGGLIDHFVPKAYIVKLLSGPRKRVIARATALGFLASTCSHGTLALTIELYRKGASVPAVVSFLLASPWASMSLTFILLSLFGVSGLWFVAGALAIAFVAGLIFQRLARRGLIDANPSTGALEEGFSIWRDVASRARQYRWTPQQLREDGRGVIAGMVPLGRMVLGWVQLGLLLSSVVGTFVPHHIFERFLGPSAGGLLLTLLGAAVIEVCSEGTAPLAYELYRHTGALGNAFAFLMGGVVTDYTELAALWVNIGRRTVLWILAVTLPLVVIAGLLLNQLGVH